MSMDYQKLEASIAEAKKFIERAELLKERLGIKEAQREANVWYSGFPKESGAVRRQSMELTRSLADLRRY